MKIYTITSHVADQVAALEAASVRRRRVLRPLQIALLILSVAAVVYFVRADELSLAAASGGGGLIALLLAGVVANAGPSEREARVKRAGAAGEAVLPRLLHDLPDSYTLINGVPMPGSHADIDHVLVGPGGVWALEAKHHVGMVQCIGDAWGYSRRGPGGVPQSGHIGNPSQQARRSAEALTRYLQRRDIPQTVDPIVVFTHPQVELTLERPTLTVLRAAEVHGFVTRQRAQLRSAECAAIVTTLRKLRPLDER
jgi:hypothetical protein